MKKQEIVFVGILEKERNSTIKFVKDVLIQFQYNLLYINKKDNLVCLNKDDHSLFLISIKANELNFYVQIGLEFDIVIHNLLNNNYQNESIIRELSDCKYYILNSDSESWMKLPLGSLSGILLTYGFNTKATLTISSVNVNDDIKANICLQREIPSLWGKRIEPLEISIDINSNKKDYIYSLLATVALVLVLGYKTPSLSI